MWKDGTSLFFRTRQPIPMYITCCNNTDKRKPCSEWTCSRFPPSHLNELRQENNVCVTPASNDERILTRRYVVLQISRADVTRPIIVGNVNFFLLLISVIRSRRRACLRGHEYEGHMGVWLEIQLKYNKRRGKIPSRTSISFIRGKRVCVAVNGPIPTYPWKYTLLLMSLMHVIDVWLSSPVIWCTPCNRSFSWYSCLNAKLVCTYTKASLSTLIEHALGGIEMTRRWIILLLSPMRR